MLTITALYGAALGVLAIVLAFIVVRQRLKNKVPLSDGDNTDVTLAMRTHANFVEYVPLCLVLLAAAEINQANTYLLHAYGAALLFARIWHAYGFLNSRKSKGDIPKGRFYGTIITITVLLSLCITNATVALGHYL